MITLTGNTSIATLKKQIQSPQDAVDNVEQISVQPAVQDLLNNIYCTIDKLPYLKPSLSMYSIDGATIVVKPFAGLWASKFAATSEYTVLSTTTDTSVTSANLSPSGSFAADTIYYLYAYLNGASTDFVIRTDAPDATKTYAVVGAVNRLNERYIGSFIVKAGPTIMSFSMSDGEYSLYYQAPIAGASPFTATVDTDITFTLLPPTAKQIKLLTSYINTAGASRALSLKPKTATAYLFSVNAIATTDEYGQYQITLPCIGTPYNVYTCKWSGNNCNAYYYYIGYTE